MGSDIRKKPSIFKRLYLVCYLSAKKAWLLGALLCSVSAFLWMVARLYFSTPPLWVLLGSVIGGLAVVVLAVSRFFRELDAAGLVPEPYLGAAIEGFLETVRLPVELRDAGYDVLAGGIGKNLVNELPFKAASAVSARINRVLWEISANSGFSFDAKATVETRWFKRLVNDFAKWRPPEISRSLLYPILKARTNSKLANDQKIRLREDLFFFDPTDPILIERTDYLSDLATAQTTGVRFLDGSGRHYYDGLSFSYQNSTDGWCLRTCGTNDCSNQIGVSSLAVAVSEVDHKATAALQGHVFIVVQGAQNLQSPGLLAPSGSGSLDWSDFKDHEGKFVCEGMMRELFEETVKGKEWRKLLERGHSHTRLTGYGRMLHRGGKPEFYGIAVMPRKRHERGIDNTEKAFVAGFEDIEVSPLTAAALAKALEAYRIGNSHRLSHPLFVALRLAEDYLREQPAQFDEIVQEVGAYWRKAAV